jgi:hypothetical protein
VLRSNSALFKKPAKSAFIDCQQHAALRNAHNAYSFNYREHAAPPAKTIDKLVGLHHTAHPSL